MDDPTTPPGASPDALAKQFELYRRMTPAEKLARVRELTLAENAAALDRLGLLYPTATERELFLRLAVLRLGEDLVVRAYGWRAPPDGT